MRFKWSIAAAILVGIFGISMSEESDVKLIPSGFAYYQIGQIQKMTPNDGSLIEKAFDQHFNGRFTLIAIIKEQLKLLFF